MVSQRLYVIRSWFQTAQQDGLHPMYSTWYLEKKGTVVSQEEMLKMRNWHKAQDVNGRRTIEHIHELKPYRYKQ